MLAKRMLPVVLAIAAFAQPQGSGVISGSVVDDGGQPVRKAILRLSLMAQPVSWAAEMTDASGHFSFESLPPGKYQLSAMRAGFGVVAYGADAGSSAGRFLTLGDGERRTDIILKLVRPASISGSVFDSDGDPIAGANVSVLVIGYPRGKRGLVGRGGGMTYDRGEYRISNLPAGRYYLAASGGNETYFSAPDSTSQTPVRQFYGGAADWRHAAPIAVRSGEQLTGIDFRLSSAHTATIRGRITGVPDLLKADVNTNTPPRMITVMLTSAGEGTFDRTGQANGAVPPDYQFQFANVAPGPYEIAAHVRIGKRDYWATRALTVSSDTEDVTLALAPAIDLRGRVALEGDAAEPIPQFRVALTRAGGMRGFGNDISAATGPDGTFSLGQVAPGIWDINVAPVPRGGFIKSMRLGKQDVLTEEMTIGPDTDLPLNIVVSTRGAKVQGQAEGEGASDKPVAILLAPVGPYREVMSFFATTMTDQNGKFELTGITPGEYRLFALGGLPSGFDLRNPDLVARIAELGQHLQIKEGDQLNAAPKIVTFDQMQTVLP